MVNTGMEYSSRLLKALPWSPPHYRCSTSPTVFSFDGRIDKVSSSNYTPPRQTYIRGIRYFLPSFLAVQGAKAPNEMPDAIYSTNVKAEK